MLSSIVYYMWNEPSNALVETTDLWAIIIPSCECQIVGQEVLITVRAG